MSASTDYPPIPNGVNRPGGWGLLHKRMCEEIDQLRYQRDCLIARRDEVMRLSGKRLQTEPITKITVLVELARRGLMQVQLDPYENPDTHSAPCGLKPILKQSTQRSSSSAGSSSR
jgi:hypothetical protein